jgi:hypothetical protein
MLKRRVRSFRTHGSHAELDYRRGALTAAISRRRA